MFLSLPRLLAIATFLAFTPCQLYPQSPDPASIMTDRHLKILVALGRAGVNISQAPAAATPFPDLLKEMNSWAALPDSKALPGLDKLIGDTFPKPWERMARSSQFKVEGQEQPKTVLAYPSTTATTPLPILNPDHVLFKYTVLSRASDYFPTTQDVADQVKAYTDAGGTKLAATATVLCQAGHTLDAIASCLSKTRKRDFFYRFVSGFSGTFSYSDNPEVVQNILITSGTAEAHRNRLFSGEVVFDPSNVFVSGTDWKNAVTAAGIYEPGVLDKLKVKAHTACYGKKDEQLSAEPTKQCLNKLAGPTGWKAIGAAFLPTVDYKIQTQFDFIKSGANFIEPPYPLGHLYDFSFTQDFRRVFPTAKQREDAVGALTIVHKNTKPATGKQAVLADFKSLSLDESRLMNDEWYYKFIDEIAALI